MSVRLFQALRPVIRLCAGVFGVIQDGEEVACGAPRQQQERERLVVQAPCVALYEGGDVLADRLAAAAVALGAADLTELGQQVQVEAVSKIDEVEHSVMAGPGGEPGGVGAGEVGELEPLVVGEPGPSDVDRARVVVGGAGVRGFHVVQGHEAAEPAGPHGQAGDLRNVRLPGGQSLFVTAPSHQVSVPGLPDTVVLAVGGGGRTVGVGGVCWAG
ncbi:hypothetical protein ACWC6I_41035 [Streptomyces sp. NPDC001414]